MDTQDGTIENRTFEEIAIGETASLSRLLTERDVELFAVLSGNVNPAHVDPEFARSDMFHQIVANGMWGGALISTVLGTQLPGPGTIYLDQSLHFRAPVMLGDTITVSVTARAKDAARHRITFECRCVNQDGVVVIEGEALVIAPGEKIKRPRITLPEVRLEERGAKFHKLIALAGALDPVRMAVVHPVEATTLKGALAAARAHLITPLLVGPEARIRTVAEAAQLDLSCCKIIAAPHSHAAAQQAVDLVRSGEAEALMKGALHTDEFMQPIVKRAGGLRTERRMSHVFIMDIPSYDRPLFITDAALNIAPDLTAKRDIVQNAIDLAHALGLARPKVAVLSAVESVLPHIPSTVEAAALCGMAHRKQITGGLVDGPLAFDNAVSPEAARMKGIDSQVAGAADILVVPDLEAGNMIAKQLVYMADAQAAGVVVGARVPIVLTSRAGSVENRLASCAVTARVHAYHQEKGRP